MSSNELKSSAINLENGQRFTVKGNHVLIECESDSDTFGSGIIKHEAYKKYSRRGWIRQSGGVFVGLAKVEVRLGDVVYYDSYTGQDVEMNKQDYKIIAPENLLCKVDGDSLIVIGKRTIVTPIENEDKKTDGGIILSVAQQEKYSDVGVVVDSDVYNKGEKVLLSPYGYSQILLDGKTYFIVNTEDILGEING